MKDLHCTIAALTIVMTHALSSCRQATPIAVLSPVATVEPSPLSDTFAVAVKRASKAKYTAATAKTKEDWDRAVASWQWAIELIQGVPKESANYSQAQSNLAMYQRSLIAAQKRMKLSQILTESVVKAQVAKQAKSTTDLGLSRVAMEAFYTNSLGFVFTESSGLRAVGQAPNGLTSIEMIGSPSALTSVSLLIDVPKTVPKAATKINALLMLILLKQMCPDWSDSARWLSQSMREVAPSQSQSVETTQGSKQISVQRLEAADRVVLTIKTAT